MLICGELQKVNPRREWGKIQRNLSSINQPGIRYYFPAGYILYPDLNEFTHEVTFVTLNFTETRRGIWKDFNRNSGWIADAVHYRVFQDGIILPAGIPIMKRRELDGNQPVIRTRMRLFVPNNI